MGKSNWTNLFLEDGKDSGSEEEQTTQSPWKGHQLSAADTERMSQRQLGLFITMASARVHPERGCPGLSTLLSRAFPRPPRRCAPVLHDPDLGAARSLTPAALLSIFEGYEQDFPAHQQDSVGSQSLLGYLLEVRVSELPALSSPEALVSSGGGV